MHAASGQPGRTEAENALFLFLRQQAAAGRPVASEEDFLAFSAQRPAIAAELRTLYRSWLDLEPLLQSVVAGGALDGPISQVFALAGDDELLPDAAPASLTLHIDTGSAGSAEGVGPSEFVTQLAARRSFVARYPRVEALRQGGMGTIYKVWDETLQRALAMKVVRPRPELGELVAERALGRLLEEALITGQLDHPGIVPVHELGVDETGRAYFIMKLVKGRTLQEILALVPTAREGWTVNRAVGVLQRICEAVTYAHSKRVIHRDIKPANIMVGRFGETYLMDWGVARCLDNGRLGAAEGHPVLVQPPEDAGSDETAEEQLRLSPDTWLFTQGEGMVGTIPYMSPEQARGEIELVDERSDIYSLGAILYHLLTGRVPYAVAGEANLPFVVLMRVRRETLPPVLSVAPNAPPTLAAICERALAREIERRYATAAEMADALRDYLDDVSEAREEARRQAVRARRINEFLIEMLSSGDPAEAQGREITVREVLDRAAERVERALADQPAEASLLQGVIGNLYKELGEWDRAEPHLTQGRALHERLFGAEHADTLDAATDLALLHRNRGRLREAEQLLRETLAVEERVLAPEHTVTLRTVAALATTLHGSSARLDEAEALARRASTGLRATLGEDDSAALAAANSLALILKDRGRLHEAVPLMRDVLTRLEQKHGRLHPDTLTATNDLVALLVAAGLLSEAEPLARAAVELATKVLGDNHPRTLTAMNNLAMLLRRVSPAVATALAEAEALATEALRRQRLRADENDPRTLSLTHNLALLVQQRGRLAEARFLFSDVLERAEARLGLAHRNTARFRYSLALCLIAEGERSQAEAQLVAAQAVLGPLLEPTHLWIRELEAALAALRA
ncbi:MAG: tetratricopeptide repeat protein [Planctomycetota bacterium]